MRSRACLFLLLTAACAQDINTLAEDVGSGSDANSSDTGIGIDRDSAVDPDGAADLDGARPDAEAPDGGPGDTGSTPGPWSAAELLLPANTREIGALLGRSATDLYVGTGSGKVLHFDGSAWTMPWTATGNGISGLFATEDRFFAIDRQGLYVHAGPTPGPNPTVFLARGVGTFGLRAIDGISSDRVYAVGDQNSGGEGIYLYNGTTFDKILTVQVGELTAVRVLSSGEVLFAGSGRVYAYDGVALEEETIEWPPGFTTTDIAYYFFYGIDEVGGRVFITAQKQAVLERDANRVWHRIYEPNRNQPLSAMAGHLRDGALEALAVGGDATGSSSVLSYDGSDWSPLALPGSYRLGAVYSPGPGLYFAAGAVQNGNSGVVLRLRR